MLIGQTHFNNEHSIGHIASLNWTHTMELFGLRSIFISISKGVLIDFY